MTVTNLHSIIHDVTADYRREARYAIAQLWSGGGRCSPWMTHRQARQYLANVLFMPLLAVSVDYLTAAQCHRVIAEVERIVADRVAALRLRRPSRREARAMERRADRRRAAEAKERMRRWLEREARMEAA